MAPQGVDCLVQSSPDRWMERIERVFGQHSQAQRGANRRQVPPRDINGCEVQSSWCCTNDHSQENLQSVQVVCQGTSDRRDRPQPWIVAAGLTSIRYAA